tara:strand:- start:155 stop:436 length:282 start_codon:yes stop_codon:yes gene_type:complete
MQITVQYTGQLAGITGKADETVEIPEGTRLGALVGRLCKTHGAEYSDLLVDRAGDLRPSTMVIFDGEQILGDYAEIEISGVKTVMLMTPIAGG